MKIQSLISFVKVWLSFAVLALMLGACGSKRLELRSDPQGATVYTLNGDELGKTPLVLESDKLSVLSQEGLLGVRLESSGYRPLGIFLELRGNDVFNLNLEKLDESTFRTKSLIENQQKLNQMIRELLAIQGKVSAQRLDEASKDLEKFQQNYPVIAVSYVLQASIAKMKGDRLTFERAIARALQLDAEDPVALRLHNSKNVVGAATSSSSAGAAGKPGAAATNTSPVKPAATVPAKGNKKP